MRKLSIVAISLIISMIAVAPVEAGKQKQVFKNDDRRIIHDYYRGNMHTRDLPPGLEKQLERNGHLPPGLEKRIAPFPTKLERSLPRLPPVYRRGILGDRAVIYNPKTNTIVDIFRLVQ